MVERELKERLDTLRRRPVERTTVQRQQDPSVAARQRQHLERFAERSRHNVWDRNFGQYREVVDQGLAIWAPRVDGFRADPHEPYRLLDCVVAVGRTLVEVADDDGRPGRAQPSAVRNEVAGVALVGKLRPQDRRRGSGLQIDQPGERQTALNAAASAVEFCEQDQPHLPVITDLDEFAGRGGTRILNEEESVLEGPYLAVC